MPKGMLNSNPRRGHSLIGILFPKLKRKPATGLLKWSYNPIRVLA